jgi:hypothetical protein
MSLFSYIIVVECMYYFFASRSYDMVWHVRKVCFGGRFRSYDVVWCIGDGYLFWRSRCYANLLRMIADVFILASDVMIDAHHKGVRPF